MLRISENFPLKNLNTFGIETFAKYFIEINSTEEIYQFFKNETLNRQPLLILGGGSNILFTQNFNGVVLKINLKGKSIVKEDENNIFIKVAAGENWHEFVTYCIKNNWAGIENLSLIPGCVGAAPMQNIGAYGVELKDVFHELQAFILETGEIKIFSKQECAFGYRESIFKNELKGKCIILSVTFQLNKNPEFNTSYGAIENELKKMNVSKLSIKAVSEAVCRIRSSKLPDPKIIGNAGSFFKNPTVTREKFELLKKNFPDIVAYKNSDGMKLAAGWLIEKAGWKGRRFENFGVHKNQALVLVNYGGANGREIYNLSEKILIDVREKFGVELEREVNVI